ncbi:MAG: phosphoribosylanthranilate isomerase [Paludibacteraceae bacterium]|jgi:phosphoribosylanthranilate isomerase|nr:phosphoribosylanthranilate isomerase [Paludibacteraceae bacterium]MBP5481929.1 phosphoribosylanthranilate isomerase [Paludibacteraceae bacterium]
MSDAPLKIKVCGMAEAENLVQLARLKPDYVGFIFYPKSPRYMAERLSAEALDVLPETTKRVGVFVSEKTETVLSLAKRYALDYVQLHGDETVEYCQTIRRHGLKVIKVFRIATRDDLKSIAEYAQCADLFLFDTKTPAYGGCGSEFDWTILEEADIPLPWLISGGISPDNILRACQTGAFAVDLNSKFETAPGIKDIQLLEECFKSIRN